MKQVFLQPKNTKELANRILIKRGEHVITKHIKKIKQYFAWIHMMELCFTIIGLKLAKALNS